jgi:hypothetical protein
MPSSLRYFQERTLGLASDDILEIDESLVTVESNLELCSESSLSKWRWVTVEVFREGKRICNFAQIERGYDWYYCKDRANIGNLIGPAGLVYENYDKMFFLSAFGAYP